MIKIQILGSGCPKCKKLAENAETAARTLGLEYTIEKVTDAVNAYTQTIGIYPESLKRKLRDRLPLFGAQRLTSLGYACSMNSAKPQDAMEPIRRMCKWIVDEECDPDRVFPMWKIPEELPA